MRSRTTTALVGLVGSLVLSAVLWWYFQSFVFFLFLPFVPFLFRRSSSEPPADPIAECPQCGFRTRDESFEYCPRDGTRLE
jgi:hypothetical protein